MKKNLVLALSSVFLLMSISTFAQKNNTSVLGYHPNKAMFPENFIPEKYVLLVMQLPKRNKPDQQHKAGTKEIEDVFKNRYGAYQFQIIGPKDISADSTKYADLSKYRFVLLNKMARTDFSPHNTSFTVDFYFYDRLTKTSYPGSGLTNSFMSMTLGPIVSTIVENAKLKKE